MKSHIAVCRGVLQSRGAGVGGECYSLEEPSSKSDKTVTALKNTTRNPVVNLLDLQTNKFTLFRGHSISSGAQPTHSHTVPVVLNPCPSDWITLYSPGDSFVGTMVPHRASCHPDAVGICRLLHKMRNELAQTMTNQKPSSSPEHLVLPRSFLWESFFQDQYLKRGRSPHSKHCWSVVQRSEVVLLDQTPSVSEQVPRIYPWNPPGKVWEQHLIHSCYKLDLQRFKLSVREPLCLEVTMASNFPSSPLPCLT